MSLPKGRSNNAVLLFFVLGLFLSGCSTTPISESFATYNVNGVSYFSLTNLCNAKGIAWDYDTIGRVISLSRGAHNVDLMLGDSFILVDGAAQHLSYPVEIYQGMVVVPYSFKDQVIDPGIVVFGEVGLGGEVRGISQPEVRAKEALRLGFKRCLLPKQNQEKMKGLKDIELIGVRTVQEAMKALF